MNKYKIFFNDLKKYLIHQNLQKESDFNDISFEQIDSLNMDIPLVYKEWLSVFGNTSCLLNYPIEDYTLEALEDAQTEEESTREFPEEKRKLLLVSVFQDLHTYLIVEEENSTTYQINIGNTLIEEKLRNNKKFTTHIKDLIIHYINNDSKKLPEWFKHDIIDYSKRPFEKKKEYLNLINSIESLEEKENRIYTIPEMIKLWNSLN